MLLGNLFSMLALGCLIVNSLFHPTRSQYMYAAESLLLALASVFFKVYAAVFIFLLSAVSWILKAQRRYTTKTACLFHLIALIGGVLLNNRVWLALLLLPASMWMLLARSDWLHLFYDNVLMHHGRRYRAFDIITMELNLAMWIAYFLLIGDYFTLVGRSVLFIRNLYVFLKARVFGREARASARIRQHNRMYKRHYRG